MPSTEKLSKHLIFMFDVFIKEIIYIKTPLTKQNKVSQHCSNPTQFLRAVTKHGWQTRENSVSQSQKRSRLP